MVVTIIIIIKTGLQLLLFCQLPRPLSHRFFSSGFVISPSSSAGNIPRPSSLSPLVPRHCGSLSSFSQFLIPLMAPSRWATPEQLEFLITEDSKWEMTKAGSGTHKNFYARTAKAFLKKFPDYEPAETQELVEAGLESVRVVVQFCFMFTDFTPQCIGTWYSNRHRQKKPPPAASKPILDLAGKGSRKKPPLQKWQAFSSVLPPKGLSASCGGAVIIRSTSCVMDMVIFRTIFFELLVFFTFTLLTIHSVY